MPSWLPKCVWRLPCCAALACGAAAAAPSELQVAIWTSSCMACHGTDGKAEGTGLRLHGLSGDEIYRRLIAFKKGEAPSTIMHQHAKGYSDAELLLIAQRLGRQP